MTREKFTAAVALLATTYNRDAPKALYEAYWLGLDDLTDNELAVATKQALASCKFMPTPAELRSFGKPQRSMTARAAAAWAAIREAIRKYDYTVASIDFGPLVNTVLRSMGSWEWLCELGDDAMKWEAKRFAELFEAFASGPVDALRSEPLTGWGLGRVGCEPVTVAIDGEAAPLDPRRALPPPPNEALALVRELAEAKS